MSETINVSREQASAGMPEWVKRNPTLRRAWHDSLSFRVDLARAETGQYRRQVANQIIRHYERLDNA
jgi:hypothetical protein